MPRWSSEPNDNADGQRLDAQVRAKEDRADDDRDVVDRRRDGGGAKAAARVEDARRHGRERQQDRREQHDPRQAHGQLRGDRVEAGRDDRDDLGREDGHDHGQREQDDEHHVQHGRHDAPGAVFLVAAEHAGQDRDHRRAQRTGGDELEDRVGDAESGEVGVQLRARAELVGDDDDADIAKDARHEKRDGHDEAGAGKRAPAHGLVEPADPDDRG